MHFPNRGFRLATLFSILIFAPSALAATISGTITDASNGKPVVFATVRILELANEVHTDADGKYIFKKIPAGRYTVTVTFAGYLDYAIGVVETSAASANTLDAALQPDIAPVYRERMDSDGRVKSGDGAMSANSIRENPIRMSDMPIRSYEDYIAIQPGTVRRFYGAPVHVRGGRIEEFGYDVDGFPQQDPFTGRSFTAINANTIDDIRFYPGYSDPSHGWLASGRAEVTTRETWATGGSIEAITDNFHGERSDYNLYALDLSGPILAKTPGQLTYAVAGEYRTFGTRDPGGPGDWNYLGAWHANLRWRPSDRTSALLGTRGSYEDWKHTPRAYLFDAVHAPRGIDKNNLVFGTFEHDLAHRTNLSASVNWFSASHRQGDGVHFDDIWGYGRPSGNPRFDQTTLFWSWDDIYLDQDSLANQRYIPVHTPVIESTLTVTLPGGESAQKSFNFRGDEGSVWDDYFKQKGSYIGGRAELSRGHSGGVTEVGVEFRRHTARAYHHLFPTLIYQGRNGGFDDVNRYGYDELGNEIDEGLNGIKHPVFVAGYLNEHLDWRELSLDLGVRWDHFDYDGTRLVDPNNPLDPFNRDSILATDLSNDLSPNERDSVLQETSILADNELTKSESVSRLSPRLAAIFTVGGASKLLFSMGRFVQRPALRDLYADFRFLEYKAQTGGYAYTFGNPSIEPTSVTLYEAGWEHKLTASIGFNLLAYYKDISNRLGIGGAAARPNSYQVVDNIGDATAKGFELSAKLARTSGIAATVTYAHASVEERGNIFDAPDNIAWTMAEARPVTAPTWYDQRHRIAVNVDLRSGPEGSLRLGNWYPLENSGVDLLADIGSGFPYTPLDVYNEVTLGAISPRPIGPVNSERSDWTYRIDLKANKSFGIAGADLELFVWVINLFDRDNVVDVYNGTGQPDNTGWLETGEGQQFVINNNSIHDSSFLTGEQKYNLRQNDPANFDIPRQIRFGMRVGF